MKLPAAIGRGIIRKHLFYTPSPFIPPHPNPLPPGERELSGNPAASSGVLKNTNKTSRNFYNLLKI